MSLLERSVTGGMWILCAMAVRALFLHRLPKLTFVALWNAIVLRLLLPVSLPSPVSIYSLLGWSETYETPKGAEMAKFLPAFASTQTVPAAGAGTGVSPARALWLAGVLLFATYFVFSYMRSGRVFRQSLPCEVPFVLHWMEAHRIFRPIQVRVSDRISSPLTYGVLRPVILLPKKMDWRDEPALRYTLTHEFVHIRRFDALTKLFYAAALCAHWFHPLVWAMAVLATRDMELSCDARVVALLGKEERSAYALTLIGMEERKQGGFSLCAHFSKNAIEERIEAIMKFKKTSVLSVVLALLVVAGSTVAFATNTPASAQQNPDAGYSVHLVARPDSASSCAEDEATPLQMFQIEKGDIQGMERIAGDPSGPAEVKLIADTEPPEEMGEKGEIKASISSGFALTNRKIGDWIKGQSVAMAVDCERENKLKIGIQNKDTGALFTQTLDAGDGSITLEVPEDGRYQLYFKNLSTSDAKFTLTYQVK